MLTAVRFTHNISSFPIFVMSVQKSSTMISKVVENSIRKKLNDALVPSHLEIINLSYMHNVPDGSETHFKVVVVSDTFQNQPLIKRHRTINELLSDELQSGVHALSIVAKTPEQWEESSKEIASNPVCRGGFGK